MKGKLFLALSLMLVALAITIGLTRAEGLTSHNSLLSTTLVGSAFTYQGQLKANGTPVNSVCDFRFSLWDSLGNVTGQIGITQTRTGIAVTSGLFTINDLDFGASAFDGNARWLQIDVRCPTGSGNYTALTPRQSITAVPYSQYSRAADLLDGQHANAFAAAIHTHSGDQITSTVATATLALSSTQAPWSGLTGMPAGFADGIDNGIVYARTVIVSPIGSATQNGAALLNALANITDASANNPYLLKIEPGVYDLVTDTLQMKPYVDIEGSGESVTLITAGGMITPGGTLTGTAAGADNAELRFLTVNNSGGRVYAIAIYNNAASPRITHVTAVVSGTNSYLSSGVYNFESSPTMRDLTTAAIGHAQYNYGVSNDNSSPLMINVDASAAHAMYSAGVSNKYSSPLMRNVVATASDADGEPGAIGVDNDSSSPIMDQVIARAFGGKHNTGVHNLNSSPNMTDVTAQAWATDQNYDLYCYGVLNSSSRPTMTNVTATASDGARYNRAVANYSSSPIMNNVIATATGIGGVTGNCGVCNTDSSPTMNGVSASASGSVRDNYGVYNSSSSLVIRNSIVSGIGVLSGPGGPQFYGIYNTAAGGAYTVTVNNSQVAGSANTIYSDSHFATYVGASQLDGGAVITNTGTVVCAGVYDENYIFYSNACP